MRIIDYLNMGQVLDYQRYLDLQNRLRVRRRELILFCQHNHTLTAGVQASQDNLLRRPGEQEAGIYFIKRGGDFTAHEPGQCVIYPHLDLRRRQIKMTDFFESLLQITGESMARIWNLAVESRRNAPGLYLCSSRHKIASIGLELRSQFSGHGIAINVSNSLRTFEYINPCGEPGLELTTVARCGGDPKLQPDFCRTWVELFQKRFQNQLTSAVPFD